MEKTEQQITERNSNRELVRRIFSNGEKNEHGREKNVSQESFSEGDRRADSEQSSKFYINSEKGRTRTPEKCQSSRREKKSNPIRTPKHEFFSNTGGNSKKFDSCNPLLAGRPERKTAAEDEIVKEKIEALNSEIAKLKLENERVKKMRQKHEEMLKALNKEIEEFEKKKAQQEKELKQWKEEEIIKIRREIKQQEKNRVHKEKEENEALKKNILKLQDDFKLKEQMYISLVDQMKKQIENLNLRNHQLSQSKEINHGSEEKLLPDEVASTKSLPLVAKGKDNEEEYSEVNLTTQSVPVGNNIQYKSSVEKDPNYEACDAITRLTARSLSENEYNLDFNPYYQDYLKQQCKYFKVLPIYHDVFLCSKKDSGYK